MITRPASRRPCCGTRKQPLVGTRHRPSGVGRGRPLPGSLLPATAVERRRSMPRRRRLRRWYSSGSLREPAAPARGLSPRGWRAHRPGHPCGRRRFPTNWSMEAQLTPRRRSFALRCELLHVLASEQSSGNACDARSIHLLCPCGVHAAAGCAGAQTQAAPDPFGVRVTSLREVSGPRSQGPHQWVFKTIAAGASGRKKCV